MIGSWGLGGRGDAKDLAQETRGIAVERARGTVDQIGRPNAGRGARGSDGSESFEGMMKAVWESIAESDGGSKVVPVG